MCWVGYAPQQQNLHKTELWINRNCYHEKGSLHTHSQNQRIFGCEATSRSLQSRPGCSQLYPVRFGKSPRAETEQPLQQALPACFHRILFKNCAGSICLNYFISLACFVSHRSCSAICLCKHQLTQECRTVAGMCLFDHITSNKG